MVVKSYPGRIEIRDESPFPPFIVVRHLQEVDIVMIYRVISASQVEPEPLRFSGTPVLIHKVMLEPIFQQDMQQLHAVMDDLGGLTSVIEGMRETLNAVGVSKKEAEEYLRRGLKSWLREKIDDSLRAIDDVIEDLVDRKKFSSILTDFLSGKY